ncbi:STE/STE7/MEK1 protein kinase, variant [Sphaeroforma arctica JP610]|uniref:mitogen-activated protein kinase kinase n=1 Tax=Sphaeroforma arctica JP610 TaxID=667725 RepID=A0A0L0G9R0_9EUKA|nr:STE/STE7/MEK1 protein kinase, variant [Sphaeroforma arctica JP610]KNC84998.1 STE/STE7/MEK1 protein kinase, variant [Sphaeroforma arctica JP610]|eukprot:XP_014158901.1 STE/STE7/MEK1 protein kinase, variant [Sphaeroforma arctica JP610]
MAVKRIMLKEEERNQVLREIDILFRCRSPYVVSYFGVFFEEGNISICMEYMDCGSWAGIYQQALAPTPTRIPEWILQCISVAVLNGLCYLKTQKVIHRDVKPSNILLNSRGDIKLCDFNVSGNLKGSMAATYIGTARYMAPERIGKSVSYDVRVDVWSLGLVLVELGMASPPYTAAPAAPTTASINNPAGTPTKPARDFSQTPFVLIHKIKNGPPPSLCEEEGFSHTFCSFVKECLRKDPLDRPKPSQLLVSSFSVLGPWFVKLTL